MATLPTLFKQIYGEALTPLGFQKLKGRHPYFVRMIGDEIVQVIALRSESVGIIGRRAFNILGGIATVYRHTIDLTVNPRDNLNWLNELRSFYYKPRENPDHDFWRKIIKFEYGENNEQELINQLNYSLDLTKQFMLPELDKVKNLEECINFFEVYKNPLNFPSEKYGFGERYSDEANEGFLYIKINNTNMIKKYIQALRDNIKYHIENKNFDYTQEDYDKLSDETGYVNKVLDVLIKRKVRNQEILKSYNLIKE